MLITSLAAPKPIVKSYTRDVNGQLQKNSYPFVYDVTSTTVMIGSIQELHAVILDRASKGECLLKGEIQKQLNGESRAGSTLSDTKTRWVCLDLDGIENYETVDQFLCDIGCGNVDYILQWSSSMGVENNSGFRCHIFMLLDREFHPQTLKHWLTNVNLSTPSLASQLQLTKTNNALRWPLDITTCQNDKLLYIAPPSFGPGLTDPYGPNRITLNLRAQRLLTLPQNAAPSRDALRNATDLKIAELRDSLKLPKKKTTKYKFQGIIEYMANPDQATVTGTKIERGFVYFNLNGGDSWAYYHPEDNPGFIYNFKGEPTYRTQDLLPEYWAELCQRSNNYEPDSMGRIYLAFREFKTGNYFNGWYDISSDELNLAMAKSETQLRHFMKQHGQPLGDFIPDWQLVFDPHSDTVFDRESRTINTYRPSRFMKTKRSDLRPTPQLPPITKRVIHHVLNNDMPTIEHFLNWFAVVIQTLDRTGTAWVLQGTEGTGKGVLFHHILRPLLGEHNTTAKRMEEVESEFTGYMENSFMVFVDEIEKTNSLAQTKVSARLRTLIVEPSISIRQMYRPVYEARNFANMIFASNKPAPVEVPPDDRRYNVAPRQDSKLQITEAEIEGLALELPQTYAFFMTFKANPDQARLPLQNDARSTLVETNRLAVDKVTDALLRGDMAFFWDEMPSAKVVDLTKLGMKRFAYEAYRELMIEIVQHQPDKLSRDQLFTLYNWCVGNMPDSPSKFTTLLKHHRIHIVPVRIGSRTVRGVPITWTYEPAWLSQVTNEINTGAV